MYNIDSSDYTLQENITYRLSKSYLSLLLFLPWLLQADIEVSLKLVLYPLCTMLYYFVYKYVPIKSGFKYQKLLYFICIFIIQIGSIWFYGNSKECSNYHTITLFSHASRVMLNILQARRQQYMNCELPDVQAGFKKGRGTRGQIANIHWIIKKARDSRKTSALLTMPKPLTVWTTIKSGNS